MKQVAASFLHGRDLNAVPLVRIRLIAVWIILNVHITVPYSVF